MTTNDLGSRGVRRSATMVGGAFALLTLLTHAANLGFVVVSARLLPPDAFSHVVALLGIVMIGFAPGMGVQALAAAGVVGGTVLVDRAVGRRLGGIIGLVVAGVTLTAWLLLGISGWVTLVAIPVAAALLPRTAVNEGLLQGNGRFIALGWVMVAGAATKLTAGVAGMATLSSVDAAAAAIAIGYGVQLTASTAATRHDHRPARTDRDLRAVGYAVLAMATLLAVVHLDAIFAPTRLEALEGGRYATGVTATRIAFWFPQFLVLLLFPRMVRDATRRTTLQALAGVVALGLAGAAAAALLGEPLARLAFGDALGAIGPHLPRFVWIGAADLGLQVLVLADIAEGRRRMLPLLLPALGLIPAALVLASPTDAPGAALVVAIALTGVVTAGVVSHLARRDNRTIR